MTFPADGPLDAEGLLDDGDQTIMDRLAVLDNLLAPPPPMRRAGSSSTGSRAGSPRC